MDYGILQYASIYTALTVIVGMMLLVVLSV
jgi:hypothetical protein